MYRLLDIPISSYLHEHETPHEASLNCLRAEIERKNLGDMWDMILTLDYEVANVFELDRETQEEFRGIISLLLKAFAD